ncbi:hypothetical protein OPIT5_23190 [Opitutaceae bacterium TAV5]|nr:hypothetical protein OPIT5_23190 [Opitutaceae bacterium TAV5]
MYPKFPLLFLIAVLLPVAVPAAAVPSRAAEPPVKLDDIHITGEAPPAAPENAGTDANRPAIDRMASGTTSIGAADYAGATPRTLGDMLRLAPGVQAHARAGDDVRLSIRGSGLQSVVFTKARGVDVLLDGLPINSADGNFDYGLISPLSVRTVEVWRGAAATALGSTTLGGALNLITPTGREVVLAGGGAGADGTAGSVRVDGGSFGFFRSAASAAVVRGAWDAAVHYQYQTQDGFRDYSAGDSQKVAANIGYTWREGAENRIYLNASRVHQQVALPVTRAQLEDDPSQAGTLNPSTRPFFDVDTVRLADRLTLAGPEGRAELSAWYLYRDVDFRRPSTPPSGYRLGPGWLKARTDDFGAQARIEREGEVLGRANVLSGGVRLTAMNGRERLYANNATLRGDKFADGDLFAWNATLFIEDDHALTDRLSLLIAAEATYAYREYDDNFNASGGDVSRDLDFSNVSPSLGLRWAFTDKSQAFASVSRSFEPPAFGDLIAIPLVPPPPQRITVQSLDAQEATTLEIGTRGEHGRFRWEVSVYRSWLDGEFIRYDDGAATGNQVGRNADNTIHDGLEIGLTTRIWGGPDAASQRVSLSLAYSWNRYRFDDDPVFGDNKLAGVPIHTLFAELLYEHPDGFYFGANLTGSLEKYPVDNANTFYADNYVLAGLRAGWSGRRFSVWFEARNLADKAWTAATQNATDLGGNDSDLFFPGEGRAFYAGVEWRW